MTTLGVVEHPEWSPVADEARPRLQRVIELAAPLGFYLEEIRKGITSLISNL